MLNSLLGSLALNVDVLIKLYKTYTSSSFLLHENMSISCSHVLNSAFLVAQDVKKSHPA